MKIVNRSMNPLPNYATKSSSGLDIRANETITVMPMERVLISTGLYIAIPEGFEGQLRARSGLSTKNGITLCTKCHCIVDKFRNRGRTKK